MNGLNLAELTFWSYTTITENTKHLIRLRCKVFDVSVYAAPNTYIEYSYARYYKTSL